MKEEYVDFIWDNNPNFIRQFHKKKGLYTLLCEEVEFILSKAVEEENIGVASISSRAKSESSFCEKIHRKNYVNPFEEITDFSGARVVYLYASDRIKLESVIEKKFNIIEKVDKVLGADVDQFGYGALHYLVSLKPAYLKARYKELANLVCEVQVRTILQDAWAVVAHHLSYKQESDIPKHLRRKLNALSGLFETADDQFERIKTLRLDYQESVVEQIENNTTSLESEINIDNLEAYLDWKLPERKKSESLAELVSELKLCNYKTLNELNNIIEKSKDAFSAYEAKYPPVERENASVKTKFAQGGLVKAVLKLTDEKYRTMKNSNRDRHNEFLHLVK
ncbi:GTP pyrophosphokinase [Aliivibrio fischeri]|uniref:GTP pyrophosphokinase n=1 Tax=Aliivibrio fischeri TaxID=668 RepID=UPI0018C826CD|nr:hypothetical protein [Aliivibrio fischeri]